MARVEIDLLEIGTGSVSAPAGCGKTHLIMEAIRAYSGTKPVLVLTHTNAGVAALRGRLERAHIARSKYRVFTIDGWIMRLIGLFPATAGHDPDLLELRNPRGDYPGIREAAGRLLASQHIDEVVAASYGQLIVDEYQDCSIVQHGLVQHLSRILPTVVLGDPLQAIFGFAGNALVDWSDHVEVAFPAAGELATPHRWIKAGHEGFGRWLLEMRVELLHGRRVDLEKLHQNASWVSLDGDRDYEKKLKAWMTRSPVKDGKVLVIAASMDRGGRKRHQYASRMPGSVVAEAVDMSDLVDFGDSFELTGEDALSQLAGLAELVMTNISAEDFIDRVELIRQGRNRSAPSAAEESAIRFIDAPTYENAGKVLESIAGLGGVSVPRPAILDGCYALLRSCQAGSTPRDAALAVRERSRLIGRPLSARTVGSTLLLKGLEAEVSVILDADEMDARHLYVAMTRGSNQLVVCSAQRLLP